MKVWYDTEFWEQGAGLPIIPISYGFIREDGQELYLVNAEAPLTAAANQHPWLRDNVLPHLPGEVRTLNSGGCEWIWDEAHAEVDDVASMQTIRQVIERWLLSTPDLELWAWYGAYDHVVLAQTFGTMTEMPKGIPYWTNDLRQVIPRDVRVPVQKGNEHNALADARWLRGVDAWWQQRQLGGDVHL